jgi:hypothetical protein
MNKRLILFSSILSIMLIAPGFQCSQPKRVLEKKLDIGEFSMQRSVYVLASDSLEGRGTGTDGERKAAAYIITQFQEADLTPKGENGTWTQKFTFTPHPPIQKHQVGDSTVLGMALVKEISGNNVLGYIDNKANTTVVIGAHYDHLGWGDENSLFGGGRAIHNGADDNASGVTVMLALAHELKKSKLKNNNYLFIAFSGEEKGLWGSNFFAKNPTISNMNYMINMDMVGRLNQEKALSISGTGTAPDWKEALEKSNKSGFSLVLSESGVGPSDHTSFYNVGVPAIHLFTGQHADYHKPSDDADKINFEGLYAVKTYVMNIIEELNSKGKLTFQKTKDESTNTAADFKVTLGVMPDYLFGGEGMRIDGTREGRPAAIAGLKQGDIVIKIGEHAVKDMTGYMEALSKFEKGQTTEITFIRDGKEEKCTVTW